MKKWLYTLCIFLSLPLFAEENNNNNENDNKKKEEPPSRGIFSLPSSQQPGPFFAFGQYVLEKNQGQLLIQPFYLKYPQQQYVELFSSYIYGLTDSTTGILTVPYALSFRNQSEHSAGIGDLFFQMEHAFLNTSNKSFTQQGTIIGGITIPTGGAFYKNPPTGDGTQTLFIGGTYNRTYVQWYWFASSGMQWPTRHHDIHLSTSYLYEAGIGHVLAAQSKRFLLVGLAELDGEYLTNDTFFGFTDPNTGGNVLLFTPSLNLSNKYLLVQLGVSLPLTQQWNGVQEDMTYATSLAVSITFD